MMGQSTVAVVTFGDAAAHLGHKSRSTLYRMKRDGRLNDYLRPGGRGGAERIELEPEGLPALRDWVRGVLQEGTDSPTRTLAPSPGTVAPAEVAAGLAALVAGLPEDQIPPLNTSRERREHYAAELNRLAALEKRGRLIDKEEVMAAAFGAYRNARDALLGIPTRLAPELVGCMEVHEIHARMDEEIRRVLTALADKTEVDA